MNRSRVDLHTQKGAGKGVWYVYILQEHQWFVAKWFVLVKSCIFQGCKQLTGPTYDVRTFLSGDAGPV